ncbi:winged helix DNA-binding domain-containing protein [Paenibacillus psychroresistens]|uniref:Winged helix DNA-binding domain-containing protein n=1 Tax=Paenibacillus psychroresistens TaxID=1778678 RepID=A0A6B8RNS9_9BACL|nr:crosslink repair DNA glycosylase YcaQ family protein [Paenibacillus psychroresistens]QGQ97205.1 winged helix DNA-binding domain-containing protein [Paenibacillus psychroresistens]
MEITLTKAQARRFILVHQGLLTHQRFEGKPGIMAFLERVGCIQYDPLNVVGFNQQLVLQARIPTFRVEMLQELLYEDRVLVDAWDKCMSIYPLKDWAYFTRLRDAARIRLQNMPQVNEIVQQVIESFLARGPLSSSDLEYKEVVDWSWAPTRLSRAVLESMYFSGDLIIHHKARTRKVYDLANRHVHESYLQAPEPNVTEESYWEWYVLRRIGAIGLLWNKPSDAWLGIAGMKTKERNEAFQRLEGKGKVIALKVEGILPQLYIRAEDMPFLEETLVEDTIPAKRAFILAPLDNMIWDRKLIKELFHFEYRWEVYKPAVERQYGYYVLPVMYGDQFIARFEPSLDRKKKELVIKNWWWESEVVATAPIIDALKQCLADFMEFTGAITIRLEDSLTNSDIVNLLPITQAHKGK